MGVSSSVHDAREEAASLKCPFHDSMSPLSSGRRLRVARIEIPSRRTPSWKACATNWLPPSVTRVSPRGRPALREPVHHRPRQDGERVGGPARVEQLVANDLPCAGIEDGEQRDRPRVCRHHVGDVGGPALVGSLRGQPPCRGEPRTRIVGLLHQPLFLQDSPDPLDVERFGRGRTGRGPHPPIAEDRVRQGHGPHSRAHRALVGP